MPEQIIMEGDLVRVIRTELVREARLQDFLPHIEHRPPITVGLLPKTARFLHWDESDPQNKTVQILAELPAGIRHCVFINRRYQLSVPWTYFLFSFTTSGDPMEGVFWQNRSTRVFWARQPIDSLDSEIGRALVPNCNGSGEICWGNTGVDGRLPLGTRVDRTVDEFYRTIFMHDSGTGFPWQSETKVPNWKRWEQETKKNPAAFLEMPEWEINRDIPAIGPMQSVKTILGAPYERANPVITEGLIPPMPTPQTFGRAEEWLAGISPVDRFKLWTGLNNMQAEIPQSVTAPEIPESAAQIDLDPGGELVIEP